MPEDREVGLKVEYDDIVDWWTIRDSKGRLIVLEWWEVSLLVKKLKEQGVR